MNDRLLKRLTLRTLSLLALLPYVEPLSALQTERVLHIPVNKSRFIELNKNMDSFTAANPEIADIELLDATHLYILGRHLGSTNVTLNNSKLNLFDTLNIEVTHDIDGLKAKLHELVPSENPGVYSSQGSIVLNGQVSSTEKMDDMISIAKTFLQSDKGKKDEYTTNDKSSDVSVINMMQVGGPQQVMLEVKVAEMNRSLAKNLKVDFSMMGSNGQFSGGGISGDAAINNIGLAKDQGGNIYKTLSTSLDGQLLDGNLLSQLELGSSIITPFGLFGRFIGSNSQVNTVINASRNNGLVKILAEPTLTTISGQTADFLSGGEFPIPVQKNANGGITVSYKEFGVATKFLPVVLDSGRISLKISVDVSELSNVNAVVAAVNSTQNTFIIPALTKRRANSSVELEDGQTIGIAGLISENLRDNVNKFPGIGEIPVLGQLFTSQEFLKKQTELVIFVTPRLAKPMPTSTPKLPTDHFVEPSDLDFYLLGRTEARVHRTTGKASMGAGGMKGVFGQKP